MLLLSGCVVLMVFQVVIIGNDAFFIDIYGFSARINMSGLGGEEGAEDTIKFSMCILDVGSEDVHNHTNTLINQEYFSPIEVKVNP